MVLSNAHVLHYYSSQLPREVGAVVIPILHMKTQRLRRLSAQSHIVSQW